LRVGLCGQTRMLILSAASSAFALHSAAGPRPRLPVAPRASPPAAVQTLVEPSPFTTLLPSRTLTCSTLLRRLFVEPETSFSPAAVAAACSEDVEWVDMDLTEPIRGREAVERHLRAKWPLGSLLKVERLSDGASSGGFTWHREADGVSGSGLRGVTYFELNGEGELAYVQEGSEPLFKLDTILEAFLTAANANRQDEAKPPRSYERQTPTTASGIARYLWEVAYPGGATPSEALSFFSDEVVYEDFNYREPFVGLQAVSAYISLLDAFPQFTFLPERISDGDTGVCITWRCEVNGEPGPSGISYNQVDKSGKICFARDIPAPSIKPPPLAAVAARLSPQLRTFQPRAPLPSVAPPPPTALDTLAARPARAAIALAWFSFSAYVALASPGEFSVSADSFDNQLIAKAIDDPTSLNPIFFAVFNALGVLPGINAALLLPGAKGQRPLPAAPFVSAAFFLGFGAAGPYLALRQPRPDPVGRSELGFFARYVTESRLYGGGLLSMADPAAALSDYAELFGSSKLVHVSSIDLLVLSAFAFEPIREDMARRGWWDEAAEGTNNLARLLAFSLVPVLGPAAYLVLRPDLPEERA